MRRGPASPHAEEATALEDLRRRSIGAAIRRLARAVELYEVDKLSEVETTDLVESGLMTPEFAEMAVRVEVSRCTETVWLRSRSAAWTKSGSWRIEPEKSSFHYGLC